MHKNVLRQYVLAYGGVNFLRDLADVFHDLGTEWLSAKEYGLSGDFSKSAEQIKEISLTLEAAEKEYQSRKITTSVAITSSQSKKEHDEYESILTSLQNLSIKEYIALYKNDKSALLEKLKRLKELSKIFKSNDKK